MTRGRRIAAGRRRCASDWGEAGFTLVETMLGIVLLTFGLLAVADVYPHGLALSAYGQAQTAAVGPVRALDRGCQERADLHAGYGTWVTTGRCRANISTRTATPRPPPAAVFAVDLQIQAWTLGPGDGPVHHLRDAVHAPELRTVRLPRVGRHALARQRTHRVRVWQQRRPERVRGRRGGGAGRSRLCPDEHLRHAVTRRGTCAHARGASASGA